MNKKSLLTLSFSILASLAFLPSTALADIEITAAEQDGSVVFSYSGSVQTSTLSSNGTGIRSGGVAPSNSLIQFATTSGSEVVDGYGSVTSAPSDFGSGSTTIASSESGDPFAITAVSVSVPESYVSESPLSGTIVFDGQTFSTLGISAAGSPYVWTLSNGQTVTLVIASSSVNTTVQSSLLNKIKKLKKKLKKLKKKGKKAKAKKINKKIKALKMQL